MPRPPPRLKYPIRPPSFDICVPSWNSLEYLKLMVEGIRQYSSFDHTIRVHDNGSTDGTEDWLIKQKIPHTRSETNEGFSGVNHALKTVKTRHAMVFNTDMFALPGWDFQINQQIKFFERIGLKQYTISCCLIEPSGRNPEYNHVDYGVDAESFDQEGLIEHFKSKKGQARYMYRDDTVQYSHPILFPMQMLEHIGYFDPEYFPGWAVDHDIAARAYYLAGCRQFVMLGNSRVYHFSSKTFKKLPPDIQAMHGHNLFEAKWGLSVEAFRGKLGLKKRYAKRPF